MVVLGNLRFVEGAESFDGAPEASPARTGRALPFIGRRE
jgi:hypothetical protein